jgi:dTDP-4-amino-4,6-dideoxygalactose transaminase
MPERLYTSNPRANYEAYQQEINEAIASALARPQYVLGESVVNFEVSFAKFVGMQHCVGVNSGTDAIHLALRGLGLGAGDEVITVSHTAIASVAAIEMAGATPVLADIEMPWFTIDPLAVEECISPNSRAVLAVHLYGQPADLTALRVLCDKHSLFLIEDCAQAHDSKWNGVRAGSLGDVSCFSFYPSKNLGTVGDGGAVLTNREALADAVRRLRQYGWDERRISVQTGWNSRLGPLEAAILSTKLCHLSEMTKMRAFLSERYKMNLINLPISLPIARPGSEHAFHLYAAVCESRADRDALVKHLEVDEIIAGIHYDPPVHQHPAYSARLACGDLSITEDIAGRVVSLPIYPELSETDQDRVIASVRRFFG